MSEQQEQQEQLKQLPQSIKVEPAWWMFTKSFFMYLVIDQNGEECYENGSTRLFHDGPNCWMFEWGGAVIQFIISERLDDSSMPFGQYGCGVRIVKDDRGFVQDRYPTLPNT